MLIRPIKIFKEVLFFILIILRVYIHFFANNIFKCWFYHILKCVSLPPYILMNNYVWIFVINLQFLWNKILYISINLIYYHLPCPYITLIHLVLYCDVLQLTFLKHMFTPALFILKNFVVRELRFLWSHESEILFGNFTSKHVTAMTISLSIHRRALAESLVRLL